jgi:hypothetical protein
MPNPVLHLTAAAGVRRRESNSRLRQLHASLVRILVVKAQELTMKLWINSLVDAAPVRTTSSGGVFHFCRSFDLLVEAHRRSRRVAFSLSAARYNKLREFQGISYL